MNNIKHLGIMGGTFDPVHYAHIDMALTARDELKLDKLILVPANIQPFKQEKGVTSDSHRINMLEIAVMFQGDEHMEISDYEIEKGGISYTYDTVIHFKREYPHAKIVFILGSDSFMKLETWHKGKELLGICDFAVALRPGNPEEDIKREASRLHELYGSKITLLNKKMMPISSTDIREKVENEESISGLVIPEVENYIYEHRLYI